MYPKWIKVDENKWERERDLCDFVNVDNFTYVSLYTRTTID